MAELMNLRVSKAIFAAAALAGASIISNSASAASFTINANDSIYGSYVGTTSGSVSAPSSFSWSTAGYFITGNFDLTYQGKVVADIVTNGDDVYTLYTGNGTIGLPSSATATFAVTPGQTVSLYSTITSLNNGNGVCCDQNGVTPQVTFNSFSGPGAPAPQIGFGLLSALAAVLALVMTRTQPLRRKTAQG